MNKTALAFLVTALCVGSAEANELAFQPVKVGRSGPLLFFVHPEDEGGNSVSNGRTRIEVLYLYDPSFHKSPRRLWQGGNPRPTPIARLQPNLVLMDYKDHNYLLRLDSGSMSPLLPGQDQTKVVHVDGPEVMFLKRTVPYSPDGYHLERKQDDASVIVVKNYYRPRDYLYSFASPTAKPVLLANVPLERVLSCETNGIWAITAGTSRKLVKISKTGGMEEIVPLDDHWVASEIHYSFSPDGKYLALSALHDQRDFHKERELAVIDLQNKRTVISKARIAGSMFPTDGIPPFLNVGWVGETILEYGFPQVLLDVEKGNQLTEAEAEKLLPQREPKRGPDRKTRGSFDHEFGLLYFAGAKEPVASVLDERKIQVTDLAIDPEGDWAAFVSPKDNHTYLVDGRNRKQTLLLPSWTYSLVWLP